MAKTINLYAQVVNVSEDYLGPAGERFIRRQITTHLGIDPELLEKHDLPELVDWARLAFALLTDSSHDVESFTKGLLSLSSLNAQKS